MARPEKMTTPDLVTLSLLSERPMHGYDVVRTLEYREVEDWAAISRPQVYYSLRKLLTRGFIRVVPSETASRGPEKETYAPTDAGSEALRSALARPDWTHQRPPPPFLTWLALSTHAAPEVVKSQIDGRRRFLAGEIARERDTLDAIRRDQGEMVAVAELMVGFTIEQFELEYEWLDSVEERLLESKE